MSQSKLQRELVNLREQVAMLEKERDFYVSMLVRQRAQLEAEQSMVERVIAMNRAPDAERAKNERG